MEEGAGKGVAGDTGNQTNSMNNKIGYFHLKIEQVRAAIIEPASETAVALSSLFGQIVVIEASQRWDTRTIKYLAHCAQFAEVPDCEIAPEYDVTMKRVESFAGGSLVVSFNPVFTPRK